METKDTEKEVNEEKYPEETLFWSKEELNNLQDKALMLDVTRRNYKGALITIGKKLGLKVQLELKYTPNELLSLILQALDVKALTSENQRKRINTITIPKVDSLKFGS